MLFIKHNYNPPEMKIISQIKLGLSSTLDSNSSYRLTGSIHTKTTTKCSVSTLRLFGKKVTNTKIKIEAFEAFNALLRGIQFVTLGPCRQTAQVNAAEVKKFLLHWFYTSYTEGYKHQCACDL